MKYSSYRLEKIRIGYLQQQQFFDINQQMEQTDRKKELSRKIELSYVMAFGYLSINNSKLNDDDIKMFVDEIGVSGNIYYLKIQQNNISSQSVKRLLCKYTQINTLFLSLNQIEEQTLVDIHRLKSLNTLRIYGIGGRQLHLTSIAGLRWLCLKQLMLANVKFQEKGCKRLTQSMMPSLEILYLQGNSIFDFALAHLSKSQWKKLDALFLDYNLITRQGLLILRKCNWQRLNNLQIHGNLHLIDLIRLDFQPISFSKHCVIRPLIKKSNKRPDDL